ncbi:MAG: isochorismate synthase [Gemmatimonadota bacterium]
MLKRAPTNEERLLSVSMPMGDMAPEALLRRGQGGPRGFWAREDRWFAHIGSVGVVGSWSGEADRFQSAWIQGQALLGMAWKKPSGLPDAPPPRLFGGFSFSEGHRPEGLWKSFPPAFFVLPEIELMGGETGGFLTLRRVAGAEENPAGVLPRLREDLLSLAESLFALPQKAMGERPAEVRTVSGMGPEEWSGMVGEALAAFGRGELSKVVMARDLSAALKPAVDPVDVGMRLWRGNPGSHVFLFEPSPGHVLVGAPPETVATVEGGSFRATAVAGSVPRGEGPTEQEAFAAELLASEKDRREHLLCVQDMVSRLSQVADGIVSDADPHVLTLPSIQHLETGITAKLRESETVISALRALHPTPAVCGFPRDEALALLLSRETFPRGWYAGPVGWFDLEGNGVFVPALRTAVGVEGSWRLFAGAGIVAGSDPEKEWNEGLIKFQPVLKALAGSNPRNPDPAIHPWEGREE